MNSKKFYFFIKRSIPCDTTKRAKALKGVFRAGTEKWNKIKKKSSAALVKSGPLDFPRLSPHLEKNKTVNGMF